MSDKIKKKSNKQLIVGGAVAITAATLPPLALMGLAQSQKEDEMNMRHLNDQNDVEEIANHFEKHNKEITVMNKRWNKFNPKSIQIDDIHNFSHEFGIKNPEDFKGTEVKYSFNSHDHEKGHLNLKVIISKNNARKNLIIKLTNFNQQINDDEHDVDFAKYLIEKLLNNKTIGHNSIYKQLLPSEFKVNFFNFIPFEDMNKLGLTIPQEVKNKNEKIVDKTTGIIISHQANVKYKIINFNDIYGSVKIQATINKNKSSDKTTIEIFGFKRINEQDWKDVQSVIKLFLDANENPWIPKESKFNNIFPNDVKNILNKINIQDNLKDLGIKNIDEKDVKIKFKTWDADNQNGTLVLGINFKKGWANEEISLKINGFKSLEQESLEKLNELIQKIPNEQTTTKINVMANEATKIGSSVTFNDLGIKWWNLPGLTIDDVAFKVIDLNDDIGEILTEVTLTKNGISVNKTIKVNGFKTNEQQINQELLSIASLLVDKITNKKSLSVIDIIEQFGTNITLTQLGIDELNNEQLNEAKILFQIIADDNEVGLLRIKATLSKNNITINKIFEVSGFKSLNIENKKDIEQGIKLIQDTTTIKTTFLPSEITNKNITVSAEILGIKIPVKLKNLNIQIRYYVIDLNDENGIIKVKALLSKGKINDEKDIVISNYQTNLVRDETLVKSTIKNAISIVKELDIFDFDVLPHKFKDFSKKIELNNGVKIEIIVLAINDDLGQIEINISAKKNKSQDKTNIFLDNFITTKIHNENELKEVMSEILDYQITIHKKTLPSDIKSQILTEKILGIPNLTEKTLKGAVINYEMVEINDFLGTVIVKVKLTKGKAELSKNITINGYLKIDDKIKQELLNLKEFLGKKYVNVNLKITSEKRDVFPSEIFKQSKGILNDELLKQFNIDKYISTDPLIKISYYLSDFDDEAGTITIQLILQKATFKQILEFQVHRFENKDQAEVKSVADFLEKNNQNVRIDSEFSRWKNKLASQIEGELNGKITIQDLIDLNIKLSANQDLKYEFNLFRANDDAGALYLEIIIIKNEIQKEVFILVKGFLNNRSYLDILGNEIRKSNENTVIASDSADKKLLPSEIHRELKDDLKIEDLIRLNIKFIDKLESTIINFRINNHNNQSGEIEIAVEFQRGRAKIKTFIYIGGFLKDTVNNLNVKDIFNNYYFNQTIDRNNYQIINNSKSGDVLSATALGIKQPEINNFNIELILIKNNPITNTAKIHVRIQNNQKINNKIITIKQKK